MQAIKVPVVTFRVIRAGRPERANVPVEIMEGEASSRHPIGVPVMSVGALIIIDRLRGQDPVLLLELVGGMKMKEVGPGRNREIDEEPPLWDGMGVDPL